MVSSVDGLAGAVRLVRQVLPQRREVASEREQVLALRPAAFLSAPGKHADPSRWIQHRIVDAADQR